MTKETPGNRSENREKAFNVNGPTATSSHLPEPLPNIIPDEESRQPLSDMSQLLTLHHQYGHIPMRKLQEMAKQGIISKRLASCNIPTCSACLFAKATKRPWRGKTRRDADNEETPTAVGEVVSVDQLESPTPGLLAQMTGKLTTKRYKYATVYVDQRSRFGYVYLQKTSSAEETIEGKNAFESYARRHGVTIQSYLADNGICIQSQHVGRRVQEEGPRLNIRGRERTPSKWSCRETHTRITRHGKDYANSCQFTMV